MKIAVSGALDYQNRRLAFETLDFWRHRLPISTLIQGGGEGAESLAKAWAEARGVTMIEVTLSKEEWARRGGNARPALNRQILELHRPKRVIAFPGADDLLDQARALGIRCIEVA